MLAIELCSLPPLELTDGRGYYESFISLQRKVDKQEPPELSAVHTQVGEHRSKRFRWYPDLIGS
jgi:hypothetical protein